MYLQFAWMRKFANEKYFRPVHPRSDRGLIAFQRLLIMKPNQPVRKHFPIQVFYEFTAK